MQKKSILILLILIFISLTCFSVGFVAVNSRGELLHCSGNDCVSFNFQDDEKKPQDFFHAVDSTLATTSSWNNGPKWQINYRLAVIGNLAYALDFDGNLWECNLTSKVCSELDLNIKGFPSKTSAVYNVEKNLLYIVSANDMLYLGGKEGKCAAVWKYNPNTKTTTRLFLENVYCGGGSLGIYSYAVPLWKNLESIGFIVIDYSALIIGYRPVKITYNDLNFNGQNHTLNLTLSSITNSDYSGRLNGTIEDTINGGTLTANYFIYTDSTFDKNETFAYNKTLSKRGFAVAPIYSCTLQSGFAKLETIYHGVTTKVPLLFNGVYPTSCTTFKDGNYSNYFIVSEEVFWFTHKKWTPNGIINQLGACELINGNFQCNISEDDYNLPFTGVSAVIKAGDSIFIKRNDNSGAYACIYENSVSCGYVPGPHPSMSYIDGQQVALNNSFNIVKGKLVSLSKEAIFNINDTKYYALDSIGTLWVCTPSECIVKNHGILFHDITRLNEFGVEQDVILARDAAGKLWNCDLEGSGCTLISNDQINLQNIKVIQNEGLFSSGCPSYHIPNSDCSNNCLTGFVKLNNDCVPIGDQDKLGIYSYTPSPNALSPSSQLLRCTQNSCIILPTIGKKLTSISQSKEKGVITVFDNNKVLECIDNNCYNRYNETESGFLINWIIPSKTGIFIYSYKSGTSKLRWIEYGTDYVSTPKLVHSWASASSEGSGFSFGDGIFTLGNKFCNKFGCSSFFSSFNKSSNIVGAYFLTSGGSTPKSVYLGVNGILTDFGFHTTNYAAGSSTPALASGSVIESHEVSDEGQIISPYFFHTFNPTVFPVTELAGYNGIVVKGKDAWIVKSNPKNTLLDAYGLSYCTEYGCKIIDCDTNFKSSSYAVDRIVSYPKYLDNWGVEVLGYAVNSTGWVKALYKQDTIISCFDLGLKSNGLIASSDGNVFSFSSDRNLFYCSFSESYCYPVDNNIKFDSVTAVADEEGGLFVFTYNAIVSDPKYPYYCTSTSCKKLTSSPFAVSGVLVSYQLPTPPCGDGLCSASENYLTCMIDCPLTCGDGVCGLDENYLICPRDCPVSCGDGVCGLDENSLVCPRDCPIDCGNGVCEFDENYLVCPRDCPVCVNDDGICELPCTIETDNDCPPCVEDDYCNPVCDLGLDIDCFGNCGNGVFDLGENCSNCISDVKCESTQQCVNGVCSGVNSISKFDLYIENNKVYASIKCAFDTKADLNYFIEDVQLSYLNSDCRQVEETILLGDVSKTDATYKAIVKINPVCDVCSKEDFVYIEKERQTAIPDGNIFSLILVAFMVVFVLIRYKK